MLLYQALNASKIKITFSFFSDTKTPAPCFDFEMCSAHVYSLKSKPFVKSICGGQFNIVAGRHK